MCTNYFSSALSYRRFLDVKGYAEDLESTFKTLLEIRQVEPQLNKYPGTIPGPLFQLYSAEFQSPAL